MQSKPRKSNSIKYVFFGICTLIFFSCEPQANLKKQTRYEKGGISFSMPGNWQVTEDEDVDGFRFPFVETSGDALTLVNVYPLEQAESVKKHAETQLESLKEQLKRSSIGPMSLTEIDTKLENRTLAGYKSEFVVTLAGVNVPHERTFYAFKSDSKVAYVSFQVPRADLPKVKKGFELVLATFRIE